MGELAMLNLVADNSGSLMECGRRFIVRTVLRQLRDFWLEENPAESLRLFLMTADGVRETAWPVDEDVPREILSPQGRAAIDGVVARQWSQADRVVVITDYCMKPKERKALGEWIVRMGVHRARVVVVGDAPDVDQTERGLFSAEQVDGALRGFHEEMT